jgi:glycosyltransferase involved in cell wall biosynthesis
MKILAVPADLGGCGYYRMIWAAEHLKSQGHDITIEMPGASESGIDVHWHDNEIVDAVLPGDYDVLVIQRITHDWHLKVIPILRAKGIAVVIDYDDDLGNIHRLNKSYANFHPNSNTPFNWKNAITACKQATYVTVSTPTLLKVYAGHGRGAHIDNFIPEKYLKIDPPRDHVFGWAGTTVSHPVDLLACGTAVRDLVDQGYRFRVVGPGDGVQQQLKLREKPEADGIIPMGNWANRTARLKVALAPLEISQFNHSKSRLKVLEAAAVGTPWVASPRTEYRRFHKESGGAGILADRPKDWVAGVKRIMDDPELHKELAEKGREFCRTQTIEANSWRWLEAWTKAYEIEQGLKNGD